MVMDLMGYFIIGVMVGAIVFVGYKYFVEADGCTGSCCQGRKECDCGDEE